MLKSLYIKNYALIRDIQLQFEDSFTTITGETGAGKSILLGALSLLLGNRADKDSLRDAKEKCIIEAEFDLTNFKLQSVFKNYDLDYDHQSIIRREITTQKTRAFINDTPVKLKVLQDLKPFLVDVHSQNESQSLSQKDYQYNVLDKIAGHHKLLKDFRDYLKTFRNLNKHLKDLKTQKAESAKQQDYNQFLFEELEKSNLKEGILESLENDFQVLQYAEDIQQYLTECINVIQMESTGVYDQLAIANQRLQNLSQSMSTYKGLKDRIQSVLIEVEDIGSELENRLEDVEVNPDKLEEVDEKLRILNALLQKHQVQTDTELIEIKNKLENDLLDFSNFDQKIEDVENELKSTQQKLQDLSKQLLDNRIKASKIIEKKLLKICSNLGMQNASINIVLETSEDFHNYGKDNIKLAIFCQQGYGIKAVA